jgi:hypothetical protein
MLTFPMPVIFCGVGNLCREVFGPQHQACQRPHSFAPRAAVRGRRIGRQPDQPRPTYLENENGFFEHRQDEGALGTGLSGAADMEDVLELTDFNHGAD